MEYSTFSGFPSGRNPFVPVPEIFFSQLLPFIDDSFELKITLFLFWRLAQKKGDLRCISDRELLQDQELLRSMQRQGDPRQPRDRILSALDMAVVRGTVLRAQLNLFRELSGELDSITWYFLHTARSRKVVEDLQGGQLIPASFFRNFLPEQFEEDAEDEEDLEDEENEEDELETVNSLSVGPQGYFNSRGPEKYHGVDIKVKIERPNIFVLYEQNIGLLSPLLAEHLIEAEKHYPYDWIEDAFREAVQRNKRSWSYIRAILRRWETEGKQ
jgi:DNA replication protein